MRPGTTSHTARGPGCGAVASAHTRGGPRGSPALAAELNGEVVQVLVLSLEQRGRRLRTIGGCGWRGGCCCGLRGRGCLSTFGLRACPARPRHPASAHAATMSASKIHAADSRRSVAVEDESGGGGKVGATRQRAWAQLCGGPKPPRTCSRCARAQGMSCAHVFGVFPAPGGSLCPCV